jgi:hypothetical protein
MIEITIGNAVITVDHDGAVRDECGWIHQRYAYTITADGWQYVGNDIESGASASVDETDALAALLSFLSACAESRQYAGGTGENAALFPAHVGEWAEVNADDINLELMNIEEN